MRGVCVPVHLRAIYCDSSNIVLPEMAMLSAEARLPPFVICAFPPHPLSPLLSSSQSFYHQAGSKLQ